jgi:hypothetical protein
LQEAALGWWAVSWDAAGALFEAERLLREAAHEYSLGRSGAAKAWEAYRKLDRLLKERCSAGGIEPFCSALRSLHAATRSAVSGAGTTLPGAREEALRAADSLLDLAERAVESLTGKPCRWGGRLEEEVRLRPSMLVNDLAACVHRLAEWAARLRPVTVEGRCFATADADPRAVEACAEWARASRLFEESGMYSAGDAEALAGYASGSRVQLRVGSASGHAAEIDVERGALRYYDEDRHVNLALKRLLEELAGAECRLEEGRGAGVERPSLECRVGDARAAARVLAAATSMDLRIGDRVERAVEEARRPCVLRGVRELLGLR